MFTYYNVFRNNLHTYMDMSVYWTEKEDEAVAQYVATGDERIYADVIYPALDKMAECIMNTMPQRWGQLVSEEQELRKDLVCHLTQILPKINSSKGKGYSFLTLCGKRYLSQTNKKLDTKKRKLLVTCDPLIMAELKNEAPSGSLVTKYDIEDVLKHIGSKEMNEYMLKRSEHRSRIRINWYQLHRAAKSGQLRKMQPHCIYNLAPIMSAYFNALGYEGKVRDDYTH